ncbi:MAG: HAD-IIIA family hydrolase [Muribaculaceae bacterium]|nr:HAD-IIIA family hydrolase [Muribaculaceae bacterium]
MGKIGYDLAQVKAIAFDVDGVLSPSTIPLGADGVPCRMVNIKDGYALQHAVKHGLKIAIISGAKTEPVEIRFRALGVQDIFMGSKVKLPVFEQWLAKYDLSPAEVIFVGDDVPDIPVMEKAGLSVAPADACSEVKQIAGYVSPHDGGHGVAREVIEQVMKAHGTWMDDVHAFGW